MKDDINHPSHYTQASVLLEPIDVLRFAPFCLGNALKYVLRAGFKDDARKDIDKAMLYASWEMENHRAGDKRAEEFLRTHGQTLRKFERLSEIYRLQDVQRAIQSTGVKLKVLVVI